jgi:hypothetical protein
MQKTAGDLPQQHHHQSIIFPEEKCILFVEAKTQLGFSYASISTELLSFVVYNHNSWVLASTIA